MISIKINLKRFANQALKMRETTAINRMKLSLRMIALLLLLFKILQTTGEKTTPMASSGQAYFKLVQQQQEQQKQQQRQQQQQQQQQLIPRDLNGPNQSNMELLFNKPVPLDSPEILDDNLSGTTLNLHGDEFLIYTPGSDYLSESSPAEPAGPINQRPGVIMLEAPEQKSVALSKPGATVMQPTMVFDNQTVGGATLDEFKAAPGNQLPQQHLDNSGTNEQVRTEPSRGFQKEFDIDSYCIGHEDFQNIFHWLCQGGKLTKAPVDLAPEPMSLRLSNTGIDSLSAFAFAKYKNKLRDFSMENSPRLMSIEPDTFADLIRLRVVYIYQAPKLVTFELSGSHPDLQIIRIQQTGLRRWPNLSNSKQETILTSVDLDHNKISSFGGKPINMRIELLNLEFNQLTFIDEITFNGSEIGVLLLSENRQLTYIHPNAFTNLKSLTKLDLSRTSVHQLPTNGLQQLRTLIIRDNYALKRIPSIYEFPVLEEAHLTYSYHCCSFRYPQTHDPGAYEEHLRKLQEEINAPCQRGAANEAHPSSGDRAHVHPGGLKPNNNLEPGEHRQQQWQPNKQQQRQQQQQHATSTQQSSEFEGYFEFEEQKVSPGVALDESGQVKLGTANDKSQLQHLSEQISIEGLELAPKATQNATTKQQRQQSPADQSSATTTTTTTIITTDAIESNKINPFGHSLETPSSSYSSSKSQLSGSGLPASVMFEQTSSSPPPPPPPPPPPSSSPPSPPTTRKPKVYLTQYIECGELVDINNAHQNITCTPEPDAFNPCEDIMGYSVLRIAVWFVVGASVFGNLSVIVVLAGVFKRMSVPKFLQLNLAIGDLFMGVYLAMLALADLTTVGSYFNYAIDWQHGFGCRVAGAASLFASQLSIFTLSVITFERYYTITYSIDLNMRLQLGWAARIMIIGWIYAFASAMLPIFADINSYSKTSICLPMRTTYLSDRLFLAVLLIIDSSAFIIIFACYLKMYLLILRQKTEATAKERTVAMRMALLVSTDFACWAPIIFFGATALLGHPLISVTNSKILIVFFYPLNSMANPFLYVISTRQYRRDLTYLGSRWHTWRKNLFSKNNSSYYSNNAAYGAALQYPVAGLNAHLGAVAAVTGVANHLHHNHIIATNLVDIEPAVGGVKLREQRVICTRSHPAGQYIIRHQILTDRNVNSGRTHRGPLKSSMTARHHHRQVSRLAPARKESISNNNNNNSNNNIKSSSPRQQQQQQQQAILATIPDNSDASKALNLVVATCGPAVDQLVDKKCSLLAGELECPVLVMDCDGEPSDSNQAEEVSKQSSSSNYISGSHQRGNNCPLERNECSRISQRDVARRRTSNSGRHSAGSNFCNRCSICCQLATISSADYLDRKQNNSRRKSSRQSRDLAQAGEASDIATISLPASSKPSHKVVRKKPAASVRVGMVEEVSENIDILGNISYNEPTSSVSEQSALVQTSCQLERAGGSSSPLFTSCARCQHTCRRTARPATSCGASEGDPGVHRRRCRHRHHHNHHHHHHHHRHNHHHSHNQTRGNYHEGEDLCSPEMRDSSSSNRVCRSRHRCCNYRRTVHENANDEALAISTRRQTTDCSTSSILSRKSGQSGGGGVAIIEMDVYDKTETVRSSEIAAQTRSSSSPGTISNKRKEPESILKVPSDKLLPTNKRSSHLMSLLFTGSTFTRRHEGFCSLRGSCKSKEKKRVSIMASHNSE